jgi:hypothetical protein
VVWSACSDLAVHATSRAPLNKTLGGTTMPLSNGERR